MLRKIMLKFQNCCFGEVYLIPYILPSKMSHSHVASTAGVGVGPGDVAKPFGVEWHPAVHFDTDSSD